MGSFADDMRKAAERVDKLAHDTFLRAVVLTQQSIQFGSELTGAPGQPVDTGYLRASWLFAFDAPPTFVLNGQGPKDDPAWTDDATAAVGANPVAPAGSRIAYIATNVVYAQRIEDGIVAVGEHRGNATGSTQRRLGLRRSRVGGFGSVRHTIENFDRIVAAALSAQGD